MADGQDRRGGGANPREPSCFAPTRRSSAPQPPRRWRHLPGALGRLQKGTDQLQARKGDRGREGTEHTRDTELWGIYNTSRCPRSRSTRRDTLPPLPAVRPTQALALPVRCPPLTAWPCGHPLGRLFKCYSFFLAYLSAVCGVGSLEVLVRWLVLSVYINAMEDKAEVRSHPTVRCHPPRASAHSSRLARKPGSRLRTGAVLVTVASSRSNCSSDGKRLFLHPLALRVTLEEGRSATKATRSASYPLSVVSNRTATYRISGLTMGIRISVKRAPVVV
jgi:hypothetical protein